MDSYKIDKSIITFREKIDTLLAGKQELQDLRGEFDLLFKRSLDDRPMALARARRLVEVFVTDLYISSINPAAYGNEVKSKKFYQLADALKKDPSISKKFIPLCRQIKSAGDKALHYAPDRPGDSRKATVTDGQLRATWQQLAEVTEIFTTGGYSIYVSTLPQPFDTMYEQLRQGWTPSLLRKKEGVFPLIEALDLLFRSVVRSMQPEWLNIITKYSKDNTLPTDLSEGEETALRQLRNLGLIDHNSNSLFKSTRSTKVWPTQRGQFMLALYNGQEIDVNTERLAREVIKKFAEIEQDQPALLLLHKIQRSGRISSADEDLARRLRNLNIITHSTDLLAATKELMLTDLGHYILDEIDDHETGV